MLNRIFLYFSILLFILSLVFYFSPELDLYISNLNYSKDLGFIYKTSFINIILFKGTIIFSVIYILSLIFHIIFKIYHKDIKFLDVSVTNLLVIVLASGLFVHVVLKDNFGRPRPSMVREFKGLKTFVPIYVKSDGCYKNCSFPSGHAAAAFNVSLLGYYFAYPYNIIIFSFSFFMSLLVGGSRILQGGHFTSDILVSGAIVYFTTFIFHKIIKPRINKYYSGQFRK